MELTHPVFINSLKRYIISVITFLKAFMFVTTLSVTTQK